jgi:hypothetical protein
MKSPEKPISKESAKERHRHRDHHDHSTPQARADCVRCLRKREKKDKLEKLIIVPLPQLQEDAKARLRVGRIERSEAKDGDKTIEDREKVFDEVCSKKKTKPVLSFVIEKKPERMQEPPCQSHSFIQINLLIV